MDETEVPVAWTKAGPKEWTRADGVSVLFDEHYLNNYRVVTRHGTTMMMSHAHRESTVRRFKTPEQAMQAADRHWPMKQQAVG